MSSKYDSMYSDLQSHLDTIKTQFISIDDEITKLLSASTSDEIATLSASVAKGVDQVHSIILDYSEIVAEIKRGIQGMDDDTMKAEEQQIMDNRMESIDGKSGLALNPVRLSANLAKIEARFARCISTASMRVSALERIIKPNLSTAVHPSNSIHSTSSTVPSIDSTAAFQSLIDRITTIESNSNDKPNLSLPPIKLECFDGSDITKWPAYKYQLDQLILNNSSLNEVERAFHVRSSLKGAALSLVSSIPTNQNFLAKIIERLELEFSRSNLTQATLLQSLLKIHSKSTRLEDQLDAVRSMINLAQTIDESCGINGLLTQQQLVDRIHPRFIAVIWKQRPATLLAALEFIEESLRNEQEEATITLAISRSSHQATLPIHYGNSDPRFQLPHANMGSANHPYPSKKQSNEPMCVFCGSHAYSADCSTVKSVKDRKTILRSKSLCFCCFSSKHSSADCSKKCTNCSEKHHKSLCEKHSPNPFNTSTNTNQ